MHVFHVTTQHLILAIAQYLFPTITQQSLPTQYNKTARCMINLSQLIVVHNYFGHFYLLSSSTKAQRSTISEEGRRVPHSSSLSLMILYFGRNMKTQKTPPHQCEKEIVKALGMTSSISTHQWKNSSVRVSNS
jgi:hypothetical protein